MSLASVRSRAWRTRCFSVRYCSAARLGGSEGRGTTRGCWITSWLANCSRVRSISVPSGRRFHQWTPCRLPSARSTSASSSSPPSRSLMVSAVVPHWPRAGFAGDQSSASTGSQVSRAQAARTAATMSPRVIDPTRICSQPCPAHRVTSPDSRHLSRIRVGQQDERVSHGGGIGDRFPAERRRTEGGGHGMEAVLELLGTLLVILGVGAGVWAIATGHIYGTFKAATENPLFAVAAVAGIVFVVAGLILGNVSLSGAVHNFEHGVGWVLTIGGILLVVALLTGITQ